MPTQRNELANYRKRMAENALRHRRKTLPRCKAFVLDYKLAHPCVDCGEADPIVLDFDHVRGEKIASVARLVSVNASLDIIADEIDKCEVRCANCHRRVTYQRRHPN